MVTRRRGVAAATAGQPGTTSSHPVAGGPPKTRKEGAVHIRDAAATRHGRVMVLL